MKNQWLTIMQLDQQLTEWKMVSKKYGKPRAGWIKTLRVALSMSAEQFAERLGVTRGRVNQLENAEIQNSVTLRTLEEAANALGCELIYAIVPKGSSTLENIIKKRADEIAKERVARVAHSMSLEAQSVETDMLKIQQNELSKNLAAHLNKKFWSAPDKINSLAEAICKELQKNKEELPKKGLKNDQKFIQKLKEYLIEMQNNKNIQESDLVNKLENSEYVNALKNAIIRYQTSHKKQNKESDLFNRLIKNLQKKK